jgi:hypothetical protein
MSERTDPRGNATPLLPPWATDHTIENATTALVREIEAFYGLQQYEAEKPSREEKRVREQVCRVAPTLIRETEAFLAHISEGY